MDTNEIVPGSAEDRDPNRHTLDATPTLDEALAAVQREAEVGDLTSYAIQIGILASGQVTYKIYVKEQDDTLSGVISL